MNQGHGTPPRDGLADALAAVVAAYGLPTETCSECHGGEWVEGDVTTIAIHDSGCLLGQQREALDV